MSTLYHLDVRIEREVFCKGDEILFDLLGRSHKPQGDTISILRNLLTLTSLGFERRKTGRELSKRRRPLQDRSCGARCLQPHWQPQGWWRGRLSSSALLPHRVHWSLLLQQGHCTSQSRPLSCLCFAEADEQCQQAAWAGGRRWWAKRSISTARALTRRRGRGMHRRWELHRLGCSSFLLGDCFQCWWYLQNALSLVTEDKKRLTNIVKQCIHNCAKQNTK